MASLIKFIRGSIIKFIMYKHLTKLLLAFRLARLWRGSELSTNQPTNIGAA
jgi:hypothetical protein